MDFLNHANPDDLLAFYTALLGEITRRDGSFSDRANRRSKAIKARARREYRSFSGGYDWT